MNEITDIRKDLLDATREGRVQDWNERIADIAQEVGLKLEHINWNGSPAVVASKIVQMCKGQFKNFDELKAVIDSKK